MSGSVRRTGSREVMAFRIFSTWGEAHSAVRLPWSHPQVPAPGLPIRPSAPHPLGRSLPVPCLQSRATYLLSVGRDDADLFGRDTGAASLALALQQLLEVVDQHLDLSRVEERGALGLSPVFPANPVEDDGEALGVESVGLCSACGSGLPPPAPSLLTPLLFWEAPPRHNTDSGHRARCSRRPSARCHRRAHWGS